MLAMVPMLRHMNLSYGSDNPAAMQLARPLIQIMWPFSRNATPATDDPPQAARPQPQAASVADVIHALPDPAFVVDAQGRVLHANALAREVLETDPQGLHLSASIRNPAVLEAVAAAAAGEDAVSVDYELRVPMPRSFRAHASPLGQGQGALVVLRDLTREQQIERMRADFVANASHELRTPLTALTGFLETILGAARNDEKAQAKFLGLMRSQAERMRRLIDDLLSLSRIEMNEHVRPQGEVDLAQVAAHVRDVLSGTAREFGCELTLATDGPAARHRQPGRAGAGGAEPGRERAEICELRQAGRDHAPPGGRLCRTHRARPRPRHRARAHSRASPSASTGSMSRKAARAAAPGLGLAIVKHIVSRHRGRLTIVSELGKGSEFSVKLPLKT